MFSHKKLLCIVFLLMNTACLAWANDNENYEHNEFIINENISIYTQIETLNMEKSSATIIYKFKL